MRVSLRWTKAMERRLFTLAVKQQYQDGDNTGASCVFLKINQRVGVKLYDSWSTRDHCWKIQKTAYQHGLGPRVGSKFFMNQLAIIAPTEDEARQLVVEKIFGYVTEVAKVIPWSVEIDDLLLRRLQVSLWDAGIDYTDMHQGNVGYIGKKLVCIDFDNYSCRLRKGKTKKIKEGQGCPKTIV